MEPRAVDLDASHQQDISQRWATKSSIASASDSKSIAEQPQAQRQIQQRASREKSMVPFTPQPPVSTHRECSSGTLLDMLWIEKGARMTFGEWCLVVLQIIVMAAFFGGLVLAIGTALWQVFG